MQWQDLDHPSRVENLKNMKPNMFARLISTVAEQASSCGTFDSVRHWELARGLGKDDVARGNWDPGKNTRVAVKTEGIPFTKPPDMRNHVLVVDDDALVRGSLAEVLKSEGYMVDEAENGMQAVTRAIQHKPDLVLLDINMPQWDGWTALSQLGRVTPSVPVIVITARPNQYEKAVRLGVDAFMEKPLNICTLIEAIKLLTSISDRRSLRGGAPLGVVTKLLGNLGY